MSDSEDIPKALIRAVVNSHAQSVEGMMAYIIKLEREREDLQVALDLANGQLYNLHDFIASHDDDWFDDFHTRHSAYIVREHYEEVC